MRINYFFLAFFLIACREKRMYVRHIDLLTEIDTVTTERNVQYNRSDYFIVFNYKKNDQSLAIIKKYMTEYSSNFSKEFDNYHIFFYKNSGMIDTNYIKSFPKGKSYKALLDETPLLEYQWYEGRLIAF